MELKCRGVSSAGVREKLQQTGDKMIETSAWRRTRRANKKDADGNYAFFADGGSSVARLLVDGGGDGFAEVVFA